ncbi:hypothetical protein BDZ89DRAFT_274143 [Hymenopellis radicata]|nr:hypothetical protein BDZ89DRAFT_274143 [Hymenopellis radicata]
MLRTLNILVRNVACLKPKDFMVHAQKTGPNHVVQQPIRRPSKYSNLSWSSRRQVPIGSPPPYQILEHSVELAAIPVFSERKKCDVRAGVEATRSVRTMTRESRRRVAEEVYDFKLRSRFGSRLPSTTCCSPCWRTIQHKNPTAEHMVPF